MTSQPPCYRGYRFPPEIISHAVWLYHRFGLSFRRRRRSGRWQVARHLASNLLVFSTGAEVEFADREAVEQVLEQGRADGHPVRGMIHRVVQSDLFRSR